MLIELSSEKCLSIIPKWFQLKKYNIKKKVQNHLPEKIDREKDPESCFLLGIGDLFFEEATQHFAVDERGVQNLSVSRGNTHSDVNRNIEYPLDQKRDWHVIVLLLSFCSMDLEHCFRLRYNPILESGTNWQRRQAQNCDVPGSDAKKISHLIFLQRKLVFQNCDFALLHIFTMNSEKTVYCQTILWHPPKCVLFSKNTILMTQKYDQKLCLPKKLKWTFFPSSESISIRASQASLMTT